MIKILLTNDIACYDAPADAAGNDVGSWFLVPASMPRGKFYGNYLQSVAIFRKSFIFVGSKGVKLAKKHKGPEDFIWLIDLAGFVPLSAFSVPNDK